MSRLPIPGEDDGQWGSLLNDFLLQSHTPNGGIKSGSIHKDAIADGAVDESKLKSSILMKLNTSVPYATASDKGTIQLAGDISGTAEHPTVPGLMGKVDNTVKIAGHPLTSDIDISSSDIVDLSLIGRAVVTAIDRDDVRSILGICDLSGGNSNQVLCKKTDSDYDTEWKSIVEDDINAKKTDIAPSQNAVFNALSEKAPIYAPSFTERITSTFHSANNFSNGLIIQKKGSSDGIDNAVKSGAEVGYHSFHAWGGEQYKRLAYEIVVAKGNITSTTGGGIFKIVTRNSDNNAEVARLCIEEGGVYTSTDSTTNLGSPAYYWLNTYTDNIYLNPTARLHGYKAGTVTVSGNLDVSENLSFGAWLKPNTTSINNAPQQVCLMKQNQKNFTDSIMAIAGSGDVLYCADKNSAYTISSNYGTVSSLFDGSMSTGLIIQVADLETKPLVVTIECVNKILESDVTSLIITGHNLWDLGTLKNWKVETKDSSGVWRTEFERADVNDRIKDAMSIPLHVVDGTYSNGNSTYHSIYGVRLTISEATGVSWAESKMYISSLQMRDYRPSMTAAAGVGAVDIRGGKMYGDLAFEKSNITTDTNVGMKIGTSASQKIGFYNATPISRPSKLTSKVTKISHTEPGVLDYSISDLTNGGFGFATKDEGNTVLKVVENLQTRVNELEAKLASLGLLEN